MKVEIHITTTELTNNELDGFVHFCRSIDSKPIIIELNQANISQHPMISKTVNVKDRAELNKTISDLKQSFKKAGYAVTRVKLEVIIEDSDIGRSYFPEYKGGYFEWHAQIGKESSEKISKKSRSYSVHISQNALKDRTDSRLITIRDSRKQPLINQVNALKRAFRAQGTKIEKEAFEYCIYDSNKSLDSGWIETPEITDKTYLNLLSFEAFLRRAAQLDQPFMLKGSLLTRQYFKNKEDRAVEDMDFLYFGQTKDDKEFMTSELSQWVQSVTQSSFDDGVQYEKFDENPFWRMIDYAMDEDFPTVNTDLSCTVKNTKNSKVALDISWGLPLNIEPVSMMYQPLEGEPFEIKYTTPLVLQISWKLHQCVVRPRLKDLIDIVELLKGSQLTVTEIKLVVSEFKKECEKDRVDFTLLNNYMNGQIYEFINYKPKRWLKFFGKSKQVNQPLPNMGQLNHNEIDFLHLTFHEYQKKYKSVNVIIMEFEKALNKFELNKYLEPNL